jgi:hypothetical protein
VRVGFLIKEGIMTTEIYCHPKKVITTRILMGLLLVIGSLACSLLEDDASILRGSGDVILKAMPIKTFNQIRIDVSGEIYISQGETEALIVEADENLFQYLRIQVKDETLSLGFAKEVTNIQPSKPFRFTLVVKELKGLVVSGSAVVYSQGIRSDGLEVNLGGSGNLSVVDILSDHLDINHSGSGDVNVKSLESGELSIDLSGSGDIQIDFLHAKVVDVKATGSGDVILSGEAEEQQINLIGSSDYLAGGLHSEDVFISMVATGKVTVWATESLKVRVTPRIGKIVYYGDPELTIKSSDLKHIKAMGEVGGRRNPGQEVKQ